MMVEQIQSIILHSNELYDLLNQKILHTIEKIPSKFEKKTPELKEVLNKSYSQISKDFDNLTENKDQIIGQINENIINEIQTHSSRIKEVLSNFKSEIGSRCGVEFEKTGSLIQSRWPNWGDVCFR